jgi:hypothetical protein
MIVLGDFNDFDRDLRDAGNNRPISKVIRSSLTLLDRVHSQTI